jgi:hypothetical protein
MDVDSGRIVVEPPLPLSADEPLPADEPAPPAPPAPPPAPAIDPRLAEVERAAAMGDWGAVLRLAETVEDAEKLPANLGLIWALARKETLPPDDRSASAVTKLAVRSAASLLGVADKSDLALLIAKRLLRKNPGSWRQAPAPSTGISIFIMVVALVVGSAIGLLLSGVPLRLDFWR